MAFWKHLLVLFGGFNDPGGPKTHYLGDTWVFDTQEYKWTQVCMGPTQQSPQARSGFSFMAMPDGVVLHGGYCKDYTKGKKVQGTALDDTWFLKSVFRPEHCVTEPNFTLAAGWTLTSS